ncbi:MAG: SRPBCC domain-containing protein [Flavobacteriales bacterium]
MNEAVPLVDREVRTTRMLSYPREVIFHALTDPEVLQRWWGPKGFTNTFHTFDLKPEGQWEFTMHGPNGEEFHNTCVFKRIEAPVYFEFDHVKEMHFYTAIFALMKVGEGTRLDWIMRFGTAAELYPIRTFIAQANEENIDRLEAELDLLEHHDRTQEQ